MQITNTNSQLKIVNSSLVEYYKYETIKSVSWASDSKGFYISINFISNDKNNSLRLYLVDIDNQGSWTNDATGIQQAVNDISSWMLAASAYLPIGEQRTAFFGRSSGVTANYPAGLHKFSVSSVGTGNVLLNGVILKPGETINFDAGDPTNYFGSGSFSLDTTTSGAEAIIVFVQ